MYLCPFPYPQGAWRKPRGGRVETGSQAVGGIVAVAPWRRIYIEENTGPTPLSLSMSISFVEASKVGDVNETKIWT
jgi:hypothetical protein